MKVSKCMRLSAVFLVLLLVFLSGCATKNNKTSSLNFVGTPWEVTEYDLNEIVDASGEYIVDKLNNVTVSELKQVGDKQVIYHLGQPYLFHAMHMRIDRIMDAKVDDATLKASFEEGVRLIKESGYNTVVLYLSWNRFYDGKNYDFSEIEYQYSIAKKYDLKIMWNWFGYDVSGWGGYRSWQLNDLEKYPPLRDENGEIIYGTGDAEGKPIPDLSAQTFIDAEVEALNQLCAWLNVNDTDRRTIGIQLENETNMSAGGYGLWFSQYDALANLLDKLGEAIKNGPYSMLTYLNLMAEGWDQPGNTFNNQVLGLIQKENIDIVGWDLYTPSLAESSLYIDYIEQGNNPHLMVEFGSSVWSVPAQTNILLSNGYGIGYYVAVQYNNAETEAPGFFRFGTKDDPYIYRDGTETLGGNYSGELENIASEFIMFNHSINALSQVIAVAPNANMIYFNKNMLAKNVETKTLLDKTFTFESTCGDERYGSTGLLIKSDNNTYYVYGSKSAAITLDGGIKFASEGDYRNGEWVKTKDVTIIDGKLALEPGKAYQFII